MKSKAAAPRAARAGAVGFTALALLLTALTAFLLSRVFGEGKYATEPLEDVVVAAHDLLAAEIIKEDDVKVVQWPKSTIPDEAIRRLDDVLGPKPTVPVIGIMRGEAILTRRLASPEQGTGMASRVPQDKRGFPIQVERWIADARLVYPGAVVDVIATLEDPVERTPVTLTVLQRLTVLAVNGDIDAASAKGDDDEQKRQQNAGGAVVTVLVSPGEVEILALAAREGKLDLALRNANDTDNVSTQGSNTFSLLGRPFPGTAQTATAATTVTVPLPGLRRDPKRAALRDPPVGREPPPPAEPAESGSIRTIRIGGK